MIVNQTALFLTATGIVFLVAAYFTSNRPKF